MRRRQKRLPDFTQARLPLQAAEVTVPAPRTRAEARFVDDNPQALKLGVEPLADYLREHGLGWVLRLRQELAALDYTSLLTAYQGSGRPPFHPRTLLGLIVYGVLLRQWSLRELERLAVRDVGAWWVCGGHQPDHSTIGEFVVRHAAVLTEEFFVALVTTLVRRLHLAPGVVAGDGTVIEAVASHLHTLKQEAAALAAQRAQQAAAAAPANATLAAHAAQAAAVATVVAERGMLRAAKGQDAAATQIAPSEPEAVVQPRKDGAVRPAYKPSTFVHERGLIVGQTLHPSSETAVVPALVGQHHRAFGTVPPTLLLDAAFCTVAVLAPAVAQNIDVLCPSGKARDQATWEKRGAPGLFGKRAFHYEDAANAYRCPAGHFLTQIEQSRDGARRRYRRYATRACATCGLRTRCTTSRTGRTIMRYDGEEYKEAMAEVLRQPRARRQYRRRAAIAERPFAALRCRQGLTRFHRRGRAGAAVEFALHCIAFNLNWALNYRERIHFGGCFIAVWVRIEQSWHLMAVMKSSRPQP